MKTIKIIGIIPARFASTRFPGKPLAKIRGISMIERVYRQCTKASTLSSVFVATDDKTIFKHVKSFGGNVVMTSPVHQSGTDRCMEAIRIIEDKHEELYSDVIFNIQGDEPLIDPKVIDALAKAFRDPSVDIATVATAFSDSSSVQNPNTVKIVTDINQNALYFSRSPVPFFRNQAPSPDQFLKHIGMYAYRKAILKQITGMPQSALEKTESLEQLRWLENGLKIKIIRCESEGLCVDVPDDIRIVEDFMNKNNMI